VSALADLSATEIRQKIASKEVSAVEYLQACLERVGELNPALNAIVTPNPRAIDEAKAIDRRIKAGETPGPLCGSCRW